MATDEGAKDEGSVRVPQPQGLVRVLLPPPRWQRGQRGAWHGVQGLLRPVLRRRMLVIILLFPDGYSLLPATVILASAQSTHFLVTDVYLLSISLFYILCLLVYTYRLIV